MPKLKNSMRHFGWFSNNLWPDRSFENHSFPLPSKASLARAQATPSIIDPKKGASWKMTLPISSRVRIWKEGSCISSWTSAAVSSTFEEENLCFLTLPHLSLTRKNTNRVTAIFQLCDAKNPWIDSLKGLRRLKYLDKKITEIPRSSSSLHHSKLVKE